MRRLTCDHTLRDHVRNDNITERLDVENIAERCRKSETSVVWTRDETRQKIVGRKILEVVPPGRGRRGRPRAEMSTVSTET